MDGKSISVKFYVNIVIIKYWGKVDVEKMILVISSIFLIFENMYIEICLIIFGKDVKKDEFYIFGVF